MAGIEGLGVSPKVNQSDCTNSRFIEFAGLYVTSTNRTSLWNPRKGVEMTKQKNVALPLVLAADHLGILPETLTYTVGALVFSFDKQPLVNG